MHVLAEKLQSEKTTLQAFELLTGHWAFHPKSGITWSIDDDHLAQMQALVGETFSPSMLAHSELRDNFFNQDGEFNSCTEIVITYI